MIVWLMKATGLSRLLVYVILAALLIGAGFALNWMLGRDEAAQAQQDTKESEAYATAAEDAVETVVQAADREAKLDDLADQAMEEIDNAPNQDAARVAVVDALCSLPEHTRPADCAVQHPHSE